MSKSTPLIISERRQKLWSLLTKGMKTCEIAKELGVDHSTISRDIKYLTAQSQNYLNSLAKSTLPFSQVHFQILWHSHIPSPLSLYKLRKSKQW